jgi:hypothetical protein
MRPTRVLVPITMCGLALALAGCSSEQQSQIPSATRATTVDLYTHCGIRYLQVGAGWFERVGGPLVEDGNPPAGWSNPSQPGRVTLADDLATFTDDAGHKESFKKLDKPPSSATNCA